MTASVARRTLHPMTRQPELALPGITRIAAQLGLPPDPARDRAVTAWVKADSEETCAAGPLGGDVRDPAAHPLPVRRPAGDTADVTTRTVGIDRYVGRDRGKG
jgi:hypothetical protein